MKERDGATDRERRAGATRSTEVRWFIRGDGPSLDGAPVRSRIDSYRCEMLTEGVSVKSRAGDGAGAWMKLRRAVLAAVVVGAVDGVPETWLRYELATPLPTSGDDVFDVHKLVAKRRGVEIVHLVFRDEAWWSVAVRLEPSGLAAVPSAIESHLRQHRGEALSCSYPTWLALQASHDVPASTVDRPRGRLPV